MIIQTIQGFYIVATVVIGFTHVTLHRITTLVTYVYILFLKKKLKKNAFRIISLNKTDTQKNPPWKGCASKEVCQKGGTLSCCFGKGCN